MSQMLVTALQDERGVKVECFSSGGHLRADGTGEETLFCMKLNLGSSEGHDRISLAVHNFTEDSLEHFVADVYNAVHDALSEARRKAEQKVRMEAQVEGLSLTSA